PCVRNKEGLISWVVAYKTFIQTIKRERFSGIVFDYDGTLCDPSERFCGISEQISEKLIFLARNGILIGIATGRGKSVRKDLQEKIPEKYWEMFTIGYYNGSDIGSLGDDECPDKKRPVDDSIHKLKLKIDENYLISRIATIDMKPSQISIRPETSGYLDKIQTVIQELVSSFNNGDFTILQSGHSLDVIAAGVSKLHIVTALKRKLMDKNNESEVLCIGDNGKWPGNDFYLLKHPFSLSVDEVSTDLTTCWNLALPGYRWVRATLFYLDVVEITGSTFILNMSKLLKD
ncbi:MAG: HAD family hydrolase, partial [Candidatus Odinarchaeota archaeon]